MCSSRVEPHGSIQLYVHEDRYNIPHGTSQFVSESDDWLLGRRLEVDRDLGLRFDGLAVEDVGFVAPLLDRVEGGASEDEVAADEFEVANAAVPGDECLQDDGALQARPRSLRRIDWLHLRQQQFSGSFLRQD